MGNLSLKSLFTDVEKGLFLKVIMDISKKGPAGIPVKSQFVANVSDMLFGNEPSLSEDAAIGFHININVARKLISVWSESKKGILKCIIIDFLNNDKILEDEFKSAKDFFDEVGIVDPKFNNIASLIIPDPWTM